MPLKTLVKIGNITHLSDARYCAGMGVEMLGFNAIDGKENFISPKAYQEIRGWISGPLFVAEIYEFTKDSLSLILENYSPDFLELGLHDLVNLPLEISHQLILSVDEPDFENHQKQIASISDKISYVRIRQSRSSTDFINRMAKDFSVLLVLEHYEKIDSMLDTLKIKGITLNGSQEIKPGLKNYDDLATVLEQLEVD